MRAFRPLLSFAALAAATYVASSFTANHAVAADASEWNGDARAGVRLIGGIADTAAKALKAGLELRLAPGWKTYWRYPGDSGVPPHFDFSKSENVKSVAVQWPAPLRLSDSEGVTIGYKSSVVFPLKVIPERPDQPALLRLNFDYAICERLCVPAQGTAELAIPAGAAFASAIANAEKAVPQPRKLGDDAPFAIKKVIREDGGKLPRLFVDVAAPSGAKVTLFAEGPSPDWALPVPEPVEGAPPGQQRFAFSLDGLPPGANAKGAELTFTAVAGMEAIETAYRLD